MHENSMKIMESLLIAYPGLSTGDIVVDIGSQDFNGSYRDLVSKFGCRYCGVDIEPGPGVDIVADEGWQNVPTSRVVISGQCVEHVAKPWEWIKLVSNHILPGGWLFVIAPWRWEYHPFPVDCWRVLPDGLDGLFQEGGLETISVGMDGDDCFGVARKA